MPPIRHVKQSLRRALLLTLLAFAGNVATIGITIAWKTCSPFWCAILEIVFWLTFIAGAAGIVWSNTIRWRKFWGSNL